MKAMAAGIVMMDMNVLDLTLNNMTMIVEERTENADVLMISIGINNPTDEPPP